MNKRHYYDLPDILSPDEVMDYLQIGRNTVYKLLKSGEIPSIRIGKKYRTPKILLADMLNHFYYGDDTLPKEGVIA